MSADRAVDAEILIDGKAVPAGEKGDDVVVLGDKTVIRVSDSRLYSLYSGVTPSKHIITIKAPGKGLKAFAFTFGS
jgi:hypothetical protein